MKRKQHFISESREQQMSEYPYDELAMERNRQDRIKVAETIIRELTNNYQRAGAGGSFVCVHCGLPKKHRRTCPMIAAGEWLESSTTPDDSV